jgi:hypothetical protein
MGILELALTHCITASLLAGTARAPDDVPGLSVSSGGHYFLYNGAPVVLVGESGTQCVMQNANIDYRRWLEDCAAAGQNCVHVWSFVAPRQSLDGTVVEARYGYVYPGLTPWKRRTSGPRAADGGFQWDLRAWDEGETPDHYWPRLRDLCAYAEDLNLVVGITVFWGWPNHQNDWVHHPFNPRNGGPIEEEFSPHATKVQTLAEPGREVHGEEWSDAWPAAMKNQWLWERFCLKLLDSTRERQNVFFVFMDEHSYSEGNGGDHFARLFRSRGALWVDWGRRRDLVDAVFEAVSYRDDTGMNHGAAAGFSQDPPRPFVLLEGPPYKGEEVRKAMWSLLVGGGHYILHLDERQETVHTGIMGYDPQVPLGDTGAERRAWLGHASRFFNLELRSLDAMRPRNDLVNDRMQCLAAAGSEYAVYTGFAAPGTAVRLRLDTPGSVRIQTCRWYDPAAGTWTSAEIALTDDLVVATPPAGGNRDWVLHLRLEP